MDISVCIANLLLTIYGLDKFVDIQHAKISRYCSYDLTADSSSQSNHHHIISLPEYIILVVGINYASKSRRIFFQYKSYSLSKNILNVGSDYYVTYLDIIYSFRGHT